RTLILCCAVVVKTLPATPGTPIIPRPSTDTIINDVIEVTVLTACWWTGVSAVINVPGASGANEFLMRIGIFSSAAGMIVLGWRTFAPKYDISAASLYDTRSQTDASGTMRGSAVMTPLTSVHIWISEALMQLPTMEAE